MTLSGPALVRSCSICGGGNRTRLFRQTFSQIRDGSLLPGYDVVVCEDCGFCFADDIPEQGAFDAYYREMSKYEYRHQDGRETEHDLARFLRMSEFIRRFLKGPDARILEIGCSTGKLLFLLKEGGSRNVRGLDPSSVCAETAKRLYGIEVVTGTLSEISFPDRSVDFLILIGVLEHIRELGPALERLWELLPDGGQIYIVVPDATRFATMPDAPFQQFSLEHINYFSRVSLENLLNRYRFAPVFCERQTERQSDTTLMPTIHAIFRKVGSLGGSITMEEETREGLKAYILRSQSNERFLHEQIDRIADSAEPILVWGVGTHTLRLLATSRLAEANIVGFLDSNPHLQGRDFRGIPILPPSELHRRHEKIIISSRVFMRDIVRQIREDLHCGNPLILLYLE